MNVDKHCPTELHSKPIHQPEPILFKRWENDNGVLHEPKGMQQARHDSCCFPALPDSYRNAVELTISFEAEKMIKIIYHDGESSFFTKSILRDNI